VKRLHSLDALRGIAALSVVIWHWQHFFAISGHFQPGWQRTAEPLYWLLKPLYDRGWEAVDLFFSLSGFIFFWLYAEALREGRMGAGRFALLRFSRLYPLHLATLLLVAALQTVFFRTTGTFFIYGVNDWQHFVSGLAMAQQWLPPNLDQSFNGPAWSVSIEVLLYGVFFAFCRLGLKSHWWSAIVAFGAILLLPWNEFIARGLMGFFVGGLAFHAVEAIKMRANAKTIARGIALLAILVWLAAIADFYVGARTDSFLAAHAMLPILGDRQSYYFFVCVFIFVVSPLTIVALALHEQILGGRYTRVSFLGDISYSTYMLHFPMQLALASLALRLGWGPAMFQTPLALALFYAALIGLGLLSYVCFERPLQNAIRGWAATNSRAPAE
jgi:peptidoglycan/LPS O-acetylase OafA/YrhL